jgi:hypothetical protein
MKKLILQIAAKTWVVLGVRKLLLQPVPTVVNRSSPRKHVFVHNAELSCISLKNPIGLKITIDFFLVIHQGMGNFEKELERKRSFPIPIVDEHDQSLEFLGVYGDWAYSYYSKNDSGNHRHTFTIRQKNIHTGKCIEQSSYVHGYTYICTYLFHGNYLYLFDNHQQLLQYSAVAEEEDQEMPALYFELKCNCRNCRWGKNGCGRLRPRQMRVVNGNFVFTIDHEIYCISTNGDLIWKHDLDGTCMGWALHYNTIIVGMLDGRMAQFSPNGKIIQPLGEKLKDQPKIKFLTSDACFLYRIVDHNLTGMNPPELTLEVLLNPAQVLAKRTFGHRMHFKSTEYHHYILIGSECDDVFRVSFDNELTIENITNKNTTSGCYHMQIVDGEMYYSCGLDNKVRRVPIDWNSTPYYGAIANHIDNAFQAAGGENRVKSNHIKPSSYSGPIKEIRDDVEEVFDNRPLKYRDRSLSVAVVDHIARKIGDVEI